VFSLFVDHFSSPLNSLHLNVIGVNQVVHSRFIPSSMVRHSNRMAVNRIANSAKIRGRNQAHFIKAQYVTFVENVDVAAHGSRYRMVLASWMFVCIAHLLLM